MILFSMLQELIFIMKIDLGKLKITDNGINKDQMIENFYSKKIPLCGVLGGGYNKSFDKLIEPLNASQKIARNTFNRS